jgi:hypothetical protein
MRKGCAAGILSGVGLMNFSDRSIGPIDPAAKSELPKSNFVTLSGSDINQVIPLQVHPESTASAGCMRRERRLGAVNVVVCGRIVSITYRADNAIKLNHQ